MRVLAVDLGGTKTLFQVVELGDERPRVVTEQRFQSTAFESFDARRVLTQCIRPASDPRICVHQLAVGGFAGGIHGEAPPQGLDDLVVARLSQQ